MAGFTGDGWWNKVGDALSGGWDKLSGSAGDDQERRRKQLLEEQAKKSGAFADYGEGGFMSLGGAMDSARANLDKIASGQLSHSREALRQGLLQNQAAQRSMAASASPTNNVMAARTAAINNARMGAGMSGQAALAGIQEQQGAMKLGNELLQQQRQQELQAALQGRQTATTGYGAQNAGTPEKGLIEKFGPAATNAIKLGMM